MAAAAGNISRIHRFCNASVDLFLTNAGHESRIRKVAAYVFATIALVLGTLSLLGIPLVYKSVRIYIAKTIEAPLEQRLQAERAVEVQQLTAQVQQLTAQVQHLTAQKDQVITGLQNQRQMLSNQVAEQNREVGRLHDRVFALTAQGALSAQQRGPKVSRLQIAIVSNTKGGVGTVLVSFLDVKGINSLSQTSPFFERFIQSQLTFNSALSVRRYHSLNCVIRDELSVTAQMRQQMAQQQQQFGGLASMGIAVGGIQGILDRTATAIQQNFRMQRPALRRAFEHNFTTRELAALAALRTPVRQGDGRSAWDRHTTAIQQPITAAVQQAMTSGLGLQEGTCNVQ